MNFKICNTLIGDSSASNDYQDLTQNHRNYAMNDQIRRELSFFSHYMDRHRCEPERHTCLQSYPFLPQMESSSGKKTQSEILGMALEVLASRHNATPLKTRKRRSRQEQSEQQQQQSRKWCNEESLTTKRKLGEETWMSNLTIDITGILLLYLSLGYGEGALGVLVPI